MAQLSVILEMGSYQLAAEKLGITQPALSRNIKTLEDRLGGAVFDRSGRKAVPTELVAVLHVLDFPFVWQRSKLALTLIWLARAQQVSFVDQTFFFLLRNEMGYTYMH